MGVYPTGVYCPLQQIIYSGAKSVVLVANSKSCNVASCIGCGIAGLGGLTFIMDYLNGTWEYMIDDLGWLAVALVIFTVWKPNLGIIGSFIFGALYVASSFFAKYGISLSDQELFKMLPYLVTIIVLYYKCKEP